MAYDGSIRINTQIDTRGFKDGEKELEAEAEKLAEKLSDSADVELNIDTSEAEKDLEKVFDKIEKQEKKLEKPLEISIPQVPEEERPYTPGYDQSVIDFIENFEKQNEELKEAEEHYNLLKIDVEEYSKALKELQGQGKFLGDEEYDKLYIAWKNATDAVKGYRAELNKKSASGQAREAELQEAAQRRAEEQAEKALQKENERLQRQIENEAKLQAKEAERQAILQAQEAEEQRLADIKENSTVAEQEIIDLIERRKQLLQEIADMEKAGVGLGYQEYDDASRELDKINQKIKEYKKNLSGVPQKFESMRKSANKAFNAINSGTKKSSGLLSTFGSRLKSLALSLLIFNWISKAFRAMISGMKKGFENFMGYSDSYAQSVQNMKNSMSTLGNQFAAAFAPIVQTVIPWLTALINALTDAMAKVTQFIAVLTGASTFTRAKQIQDKYNQSLNGTAKAADKARGALAKFDDLDVLEKKEDTSGAGGIEETLPKDMFEEVPVDTRLPAWLDSIIASLEELKNIFAQGFWDGLGDWGYRWESIKDSFNSIKDSLIDIWTDPKVLAVADRYGRSVAYMLGSITGSASSIGMTISTNLIGGLSKYLNQNKDRIRKNIVSIFSIGEEINYLISEFSQAFAFVFEAFASEDAQQLTANLIGIFTDAVMGTVELHSMIAKDLLDVYIRPFSENKKDFRSVLEGFLGVLADVSGTVKQGIDNIFDGLNDAYKTYISPFFNSVANGLSLILGKFLEFWQNGVNPILQELASGFDSLGGEHLQPMFDNFLLLIGDIAEALTMLWEGVLQPFILWFIDNILPTIIPAISEILEGVLEVAGGIVDAISGIITILRGLINFLIGVFTGNWDKAWKGITLITEGIRDTIKGIINAITGYMESMVNSFIRGINEIIHALEELATIKDPISGEVVWKLDLPELPTVSFPRLANGAVIRGGNPFMAILGDQPAGKTNIEAPLDTIKQAVREELSNMDLRGSSGNINPVISLNVNGEEFARLTLWDILNEMSRQGYDVDVLGVT